MPERACAQGMRHLPIKSCTLRCFLIIYPAFTLLFFDETFLTSIVHYSLRPRLSAAALAALLPPSHPFEGLGVAVVPAQKRAAVGATQQVEIGERERVVNLEVAVVPVVVLGRIEPRDAEADAAVVQHAERPQQRHVHEEGLHVQAQHVGRAVQDEVVPHGLKRVDEHVVEGPRGAVMVVVLMQARVAPAAVHD